MNRNSEMKLSCNATTPQELRDEIVTLLIHRASFHTSLANNAHTARTKSNFVYAAQVLGDLATDLKAMEIINSWPAGLRERGE